MIFSKSLKNFLFSKSHSALKSVGIIGSGIMGSGIALAVGYKAGLNATIIDRSQNMLEHAKKSHEHILRNLEAKKVITKEIR